MKAAARAARGLRVVAALLLATMLAAPALATVDLQFNQAEFVASDDPQPPESGWQPLPLPDNWAHSHPGLEGNGWYRMRFTLDAVPEHALALYVPRVSMRGQFRLNGSVLNPEVRFAQTTDGTGTVMTMVPQLLALPAGLFRKGENLIEVRVQGHASSHSGLHPVHVGPPELLRRQWLVREIPQQLIPKVLLVLLLATLAFALAVAWRERRAANLHFISVIALWAMLVAVDLTPSLPLSRDASVILVTLLLAGFNWALLSLFYRFSASTWRWFMPLLNGTAALMLLATLAIAAAADGQIDHLRWVAVPILPLRLIGTAMLAQWAWRERTWRAVALSGAEMIWFLGFMQFVLVALGALPNWPFLLTPADGLLLYAVLLLFFVEHFIADREAAARSRQAAIDEERRRILRDMHDGMGSQLITAARLLQRPEIDRALVARNIDDAMQDMRLLIDSLDMADHDLLPLLGNLRFRMQPRLEALGIRLEWAVIPLPESFAPSPHAALAALRIVQEALNNAVRHAQPKVIDVAIRPHDDGVLITVSDDGIGFDVDAASALGRGLGGMRHRVAEIGARLSLVPRSGGGTVVSLWLPPASVAPEPARPA